MVLLNNNYVEKQCSRSQLLKTLTKNKEKNYLQKITHLYANDKFIETIDDFSYCKSLKVIYLQNNCINSIKNLDFAVKLTHLYLQHNNIERIENLDNLKHLRVLFLGFNSISVLEGLESLEKLCELNVESQRIPSGESLIFDPRSMKTLSKSLKILNISGNNLISLKPLNSFLNLQVLHAKSNNIDDIVDLIETVDKLKSLTELYLADNPVTSVYRYRENVIANTNVLVNLDGKLITETNRQFLKKFKEEKLLRLTRKSSQTLSDDITRSMRNLPPAFERSISRAIIQKPGPNLAVRSLEDEMNPQIFPFWKSVITGKRNNQLTPRPFWKFVYKTKSYRQDDSHDKLTFPFLNC